jgi:hypothetical protein
MIEVQTTEVYAIPAPHPTALYKNGLGFVSIVESDRNK